MTEKTEKGRLIELNDILNTMDVPQDRRLDWHWLLRNLGIRNSQHEHYSRAMTILREIVREDNRLNRLGRI